MTATVRGKQLSAADADAARDIAALGDLTIRMTAQHARLTGPPNPAAFTYDRNGLRLGIAALEDELAELYDEWREHKKHLDRPGVAARMGHEVLDIAAVAMLIYHNIPKGGGSE